jgi:hypothetical protein
VKKLLFAKASEKLQILGNNVKQKNTTQPLCQLDYQKQQTPILRDCCYPLIDQIESHRNQEKREG